MGTRKPVIAVKRTPYDVLCELVEGAVGYGWHRAHKYDPAPSDEAIRDEIAKAVLLALSEGCELRWPRPK